MGGALGMVLIVGSGAALRLATRARSPEGGPQVILAGAMVRFAAYGAVFVLLSQVDVPHRPSFALGVVAVLIGGLAWTAVHTYRDRRLFWLDLHPTEPHTIERTSI